MLSATYLSPFFAPLFVLPSIIHHNLQTRQWLVPVSSILMGLCIESLFNLFGFTIWPGEMKTIGLLVLLLALWLNMSLIWDSLVQKSKRLVIYPLFLFGAFPAYAGGAGLGLIGVSKSWQAYLGIGFGYCIALLIMTMVFRLYESQAPTDAD